MFNFLIWFAELEIPSEKITKKASEPLKKGHFGSVYKAEYNSRPVAIKTNHFNKVENNILDEARRFQ